MAAAGDDFDAAAQSLCHYGRMMRVAAPLVKLVEHCRVSIRRGWREAHFVGAHALAYLPSESAQRHIC